MSDLLSNWLRQSWWRRVLYHYFKAELCVRYWWWKIIDSLPTTGGKKW